MRVHYSKVLKEQSKLKIEAYLLDPKKCAWCKGPILPKSERILYPVTRKKFCSRSCNASNSNSVRPKRFANEDKFCSCGRRKMGKAKVCFGCIQDRKADRKMQDVLLKGYKGAQRWVAIRSDARRLMDLWGIEKKCSDCGWAIHVEVIHIRPISSFPLDTLLTVVNSRSNIKYKCPNCHWIFDNIPRSSSGRTEDFES